MVRYDQGIVNPPASFRSTVWKCYGFPAIDGKQTSLKLSAKFAQQHSSVNIVLAQLQA